MADAQNRKRARHDGDGHHARGGRGERGQERGDAGYAHAERDGHFHFNSYRNLRGQMVDLYDDLHNLLDVHRQGTEMPAPVWNSLVSLKRRFDAIVCCPACKEFIPSCRTDARVIKCGHVCHPACHAQATERGVCKLCRGD